MGSGPRWLLIVAIVLLGIGEWVWGFWSGMTQISQLNTQLARQHAPLHLPTAKRHLFTRDEVKTFLAAAKQAEAIKDPLQRCLAYPDPPRSHWSHDAVATYCHYRLQPVISFAEAQALIQSGHAAELDRRLAQALHDQQTQAGSPGVLNQTFYQDFDNGSFDIRPTLDAWKRDSPTSAFAYAASGFAYVAMAANARGSAYMSDTPQSNVDAMDRLLSQADTDLRRALELNPQVTPAYVAMIDAGKMGPGRAYIDEAARRGLAAAPADYSIYSALMVAEQPKWGGSLYAMTGLARRAQAHARDNPLLVLLLAEGPAYAYDVCNCESRADWAADPTVFDNVASLNLLFNAGSAAASNNHPELSVVYLSEALRFQSSTDAIRRKRAYDLAALGEFRMALDDANSLIAADPDNADNYQVLGMVYADMGDEPHAEKDLEEVLVLRPDDAAALVPLASIYINNTQEWDKGWDITNRILRGQPDSPAGWVMRATIQENQPRPGLDKTYMYFVSHFGNDPGMQWQITHMREFLAKTPQVDAAKSVSKSR
jgi:Tfp pilus assembly protein PilF